jgi:thioredoxin-like negative regulator of GroEL
MAKLLKFYSPLCGPCKVLHKNIEDSGVEYININIFEDECFDNLGATEHLVEHYNVRALPTLIKIDDTGNELNRHVGILSVEQIKEFAV